MFLHICSSLFHKKCIQPMVIWGSANSQHLAFIQVICIHKSCWAFFAVLWFKHDVKWCSIRGCFIISSTNPNESCRSMEPFFQYSIPRKSKPTKHDGPLGRIRNSFTWIISNGRIEAIPCFIWDFQGDLPMHRMNHHNRTILGKGLKINWEPQHNGLSIYNLYI